MGKNQNKGAQSPAQAGPVAAATAPSEEGTPAPQGVLPLGGEALADVTTISGVEYTRAQILERALAVSELPVADWNAMEPGERDELIRAVVATLGDSQGSPGDDGSASGGATATDDKPAEPIPAEAAGAAPPAQAEVAADDVWPKVATLRNHGSVSLIEPLTQAFLSAGGSQSVVLHDREFGEALGKSLAELQAFHCLGANRLVLEVPPPRQPK